MKLPDIKILGSGGAFDVAEGNSSIILSINGKSVLVDCGYTVYPRLKSRERIQDIDAVCITHTHDDHVGSLSTLIYDRWFNHELETRIVATPSVLEKVRDLLFVLGHTPEQVRFNTRSPDIQSFSTDGLHVLTMASCGFIFDVDDLKILYSGDIGVPIYNAMPLDGFDPTSTLIFHEATTKHNAFHCHYSQLEDLAKGYTVYAYHHSSEEENEILQTSDNLNTVNILF